MEHLIRLEAGLFVKRDETWNRVGAGTSLDSLLALPLDEVRRVLERDAQAVGAPVEPRALAPIESQEVWAAGVTYKRSLAARAEEAVSADPYERVYAAERPELFFKATASRVRGPGDVINIRSDSTWDVPEPELAVVCNSRMEVVGYTIGNDMSSRSIEGENTLYLPQAKVFDGGCALGPAVALAWDYSPDDRRITLEIRRAGSVVYAGETSTSAMRRKVPELLEYLGRDQSFAHGCVLLTGTGVVPPQEVTLQDGDQVAIAIDGIGVLTNPVRRHPVKLAPSWPTTTGS
jgi:2-dehydro-3-deoxy-D-arabinonate dehydratase